MLHRIWLPGPALPSTRRIAPYMPPTLPYVTLLYPPTLPSPSVSAENVLITGLKKWEPGLFCRNFSPHFLILLWWPNSLTPAAVVIFGPSYLRHVSKVPTFTGMRPLGVAILGTMSSFLDPHIFVASAHRDEAPACRGRRFRTLISS